ncbi:MAG: Calx-beta domain-containing protein, partial [Limisphaerales bacterium]
GFPAGATNRTFVVPITDDSIAEQAEFFRVILTNASTADVGQNVLLGGNSVMVVTITDNIGRIEFSQTDYVVSESSGTLNVILNRVGGSHGEVSVTMNSEDLSATVGVDYTGFTNEVVTWTADDTAPKTRVIQIFDDPAPAFGGPSETNETARLVLSNPTGGVSILATNATLTIIDNDGTAGLDFDFKVTNGFNGEVFALAEQSIGAENYILAGGSFTTFEGTNRVRLARLFRSNGALDTSFNTGLGPDNTVYAVEVQRDGRILIGGDFVNIGPSARQRVARFLPNGTVDPSFSPLTGADNSVVSLVEQPNGRILVGGRFSRFGNSSGRGLVRLNASGTVDPSFNVGVGVNGIVSHVLLYTNTVSTNLMKVLVGGSFSSYRGENVNNLMRLNSDGSLDTTFTTGSGTDGAVFDIALDASERILIAGAFANYNGVSRGRMARLLDAGSLDTTFTNVLNGVASSIAVDSLGGVVVGGNFTATDDANASPAPLPGPPGAVDTISVTRIARFNADGLIDPAFAALGNGANNIVNDVMVQRNNRLLIGGAFTMVNGQPNNRIARFNGTAPPPIPTLLEIPAMSGPDLMLRLQGQAGTVFMIEASSDLRNWSEVGTIHSGHGTVEWHSVDQSQATQRYYRARRINQ